MSAFESLFSVCDGRAAAPPVSGVLGAASSGFELILGKLGDAQRGGLEYIQLFGPVISWHITSINISLQSAIYGRSS
jgi:hypothetical protein